MLCLAYGIKLQHKNFRVNFGNWLQMLERIHLIDFGSARCPTALSIRSTHITFNHAALDSKSR